MGIQEDQASKYTSNFFSQLYWLFWRQMKVDLRSPLATRVLAFQVLVNLSLFTFNNYTKDYFKFFLFKVISVFIGLIFLRLNNDEKGVQNRLGVLYILLMQCNFGFVLSVVNVSSKIYFHFIKLVSLNSKLKYI
jgi:hypothetical protein